jgi:hypothetical protein
MTQTLCIDFGTSSIRAAVRNKFSEITVLDIGRVTDSRSIDSASIRSEIFIDADLKKIRFGERAFEAINSNKKSAFHNASPKLWLKEPSKLNDQIIERLDINRRDLITGLLAYALHAAAETGHWVAPTSPGSEDIRIAHPVWPDEIKSEADKALRQIAWVAASMASEGDWGVIDTDILKSWTTPQTPDLKSSAAITVWQQELATLIASKIVAGLQPEMQHQTTALEKMLQSQERQEHETTQVLAGLKQRYGL